MRKKCRVSTRAKGKVFYPTHGIRINPVIKQFIEREKIILICLEEKDFYNVLRLSNVYDGRKLLGISFIYQDCIILNATSLKNKHSRAWIDYVCLHEIEHIRKRSTHELMVDKCAKKLAAKLGLLKEEDI
jgi:hypothetical protein